MHGKCRLIHNLLCHQSDPRDDGRNQARRGMHHIRRTHAAFDDPKLPMYQLVVAVHAEGD